MGDFAVSDQNASFVALQVEPTLKRTDCGVRDRG